MDKFSFIIHPLGFDDFYRKFDWMEKLPESILKKATKHVPPFKVSKITGIKSQTGKEIKGYFFACPLTSEQMINLKEEFVINKIIKTVKKCQKVGSNIVGLGSFTSVVGDKGITISENVDIPVTTGNSYTVATAIEGTKLAAEKMDMNLINEIVSVIGANGSIGKTVSRLIAKDVKKLKLVSRNLNKLQKLKSLIKSENNDIEVTYTDQIKDALNVSRIIITVSGAVKTLFSPQDLLSGSVVCDVARPRDVAHNVNGKRNDVLVIEGGIVRIPGDVNFNFNFGVEAPNAYACMAETMLLTLESKFTNYSLGPDIKINKVKEIKNIAQKHGFKLAGLRSYGGLLTDEKIEEIKNNIR
ncbi:MAG: shikimate dehydrogenase [Halanaerobiales bacterium]|nr:shikimate dehydrogenase [Halanaerobiales bacterium]